MWLPHSGLRSAAELLAADEGRAVVRRHKEEVESLLVGHLEELLPGRPEGACAAAEHLAFLLEGAMARGGLENAGTRLERAGDGGGPGGPAVRRPAGGAAGSGGVGSLCVLVASVLTTGTAATFARGWGPSRSGPLPWGWAGCCRP